MEPVFNWFKGWFIEPKQDHFLEYKSGYALVAIFTLCLLGVMLFRSWRRFKSEAPSAYYTGCVTIMFLIKIFITVIASVALILAMIQAPDMVQLKLFLMGTVVLLPCLCGLIMCGAALMMIVLEVTFCVSGLIKSAVGIHPFLLQYMVDGSEEELACVICWVIGVLCSFYSSDLCGVLCTSFGFVVWRIYCESQLCRNLWIFIRGS